MLVDACYPEANRRPRASPRPRRSANATQGRGPRRRQERDDAAGVAVSDGAGLEAADLSGMQPRIHRPPKTILEMRDAPPTASRRSARTRTRCRPRPRSRSRRRRRRTAASKVLPSTPGTSAGSTLMPSNELLLPNNIVSRSSGSRPSTRSSPHSSGSAKLLTERDTRPPARGPGRRRGTPPDGAPAPAGDRRPALPR